MPRMTDDELKAIRLAKTRKAAGAPSTRRRDQKVVTDHLEFVPRPSCADLEGMVRAIEAEEPDTAAESAAQSVVVALRARGWTLERIAEQLAQPLHRVQTWLSAGVVSDMLTETEGFLDRFVIPAAADVAHRAVLAGDTAMARDVLKGRGPLRKVLKEPGLRGGGTVTAQGPPVLHLQINVLPGTPGAVVAVGAVSGSPRIGPGPATVVAAEATGVE
jgi:hypothetical protein